MMPSTAAAAAAVVNDDENDVLNASPPSSSSPVEAAPQASLKINAINGSTNKNFHRSASDGAAAVPPAASAPPLSLSSSPRRASWSQRNAYTAPTLPRWRFVNDAKKSSGYSSTAAGLYIKGKSAEELAAKYTSPELNSDERGDDITVGKLISLSNNDNGDNGDNRRRVGKLNIEENNDEQREEIIAVRRLGKKYDLNDDNNDDVVDDAVAEEEEEIIAKEEEVKEEAEQIAVIVPHVKEEVQEEQKQIEEVSTAAAVEEKKEEDQIPVQEEETSIVVPVEEKEKIQQPIVETPIAAIDDQIDDKQSPEPRKRRCLFPLLLVLALLATVAAIIGIVFGIVKKKPQGDQTALAVQPPIVNETNSTATTAITSSSPTCSGNKMYISISQRQQQELARTKRTTATTTSASDFTWSLKDACSGDIVMKCEPCLFSDEGDIQFEFIESKKKRTTTNNLLRTSEDVRKRRVLSEADSVSGKCIPNDREYIFQVRRTDGSENDRCCNFDIMTFYVTFDNVTVMDATDSEINLDESEVVASTSFSGSGRDGTTTGLGCPASPSYSPTEDLPIFSPTVAQQSTFPSISPTTLSTSPSVRPTLASQTISQSVSSPTESCQFCPYCTWGNTKFTCSQRLDYMIDKHNLSPDEAPIAIMNTGRCIDPWCDDCVVQSSLLGNATTTTMTCRIMLEFILFNDTTLDEGTIKRDTMDSGSCVQELDCEVEQCRINAGEDLNVCIAIDLSGSLCNRGTGYQCVDCLPSPICNNDGVDLNTCCGNFHNLKEFGKLLINTLGTIPSDQSYSIVGFATNTSFVSNLEMISDAFSALDTLAYAGGVTNHAAAISSCQETLSNPDVDGRKNMILLISDGTPTEPKDTAEKDAIAAAKEAKQAGSILIPMMISTDEEDDFIDTMTTDYMSQISSNGLFFNASLLALDSLGESLLSKVVCQ